MIFRIQINFVLKKMFLQPFSGHVSYIAATDSNLIMFVSTTTTQIELIVVGKFWIKKPWHSSALRTSVYPNTYNIDYNW